jgi:hypothetical protein
MERNGIPVDSGTHFQNPRVIKNGRGPGHVLGDQLSFDDGAALVSGARADYADQHDYHSVPANQRVVAVV